MRRILIGIAALAALAGGAIAANVLNYQEQGGERWVIGGSLDVASGGEIDVESGGALKIAGTAVTAAAAELNIVDGVTSTAAELNILDGVTSTAAELNILDGVTSTAAELNILDGVTATAAELNILDGVTSTAAELNILDGVTSTAAELNILDGVTATAAEINDAADVSAGAAVAANGDTLTVTAALHAGKVVQFGKTTGTIATLPAATGTGHRYTFVIGVTATSNANIIKVANATDVMDGSLNIQQDTDVDGTVQVWRADAGDDTMTFAGAATTGGIVGGLIQCVDYVAGFWSCAANTQSGGGAEATPFSATVS